MLTTIDQAGRLVIPKPLRERVGLRPGPVSIEADGAGLRIEAVASGQLIEADGRLFLPDNAEVPYGDDLREFRLADQR
ncbi:MAG: AbrB/MazE/SpoVT family DNA-binding domain-containing protein [Bifidobacteriaceae bacterium]|nr:AbrB/MazE/SpoVT family DNA-binding domain-containing protein [Bifidobacteriaceae bacterium]